MSDDKERDLVDELLDEQPMGPKEMFSRALRAHMPAPIVHQNFVVYGSGKRLEQQFFDFRVGHHFRLQRLWLCGSNHTLITSLKIGITEQFEMPVPIEVIAAHNQPLFAFPPERFECKPLNHEFLQGFGPSGLTFISTTPGNLVRLEFRGVVDKIVFGGLYHKEIWG